MGTGRTADMARELTVLSTTILWRPLVFRYLNLGHCFKSQCDHPTSENYHKFKVSPAQRGDTGPVGHRFGLLNKVCGRWRTYALVCSNQGGCSKRTGTAGARGEGVSPLPSLEVLNAFHKHEFVRAVFQNNSLHGLAMPGK